MVIGLLPAYLSMMAEPQAPAGGPVTISGTVNDNEGEPIIGATVKVDNSKEGTATDIDGNFQLKVNSLPAGITVTSIGYEAQKVKVTSTAPVTITLGDNSEMLDEVVVIGCGTVRKADLAGSVSVVDAKSFAAQPVTTVGEALQGRKLAASAKDINIINGVKTLVK